MFCNGCGCEIQKNPGKGRPRKWCVVCVSEYRITPKTMQRCLCCKREFVARKRRFCSSQCCNRCHAINVYYKNCPCCEKLFATNQKSATCCSNSCKTTWRFAKKHGSYDAWLTAKRQRRSGASHIVRAKKYGVAYQYVNKINVFERDDWKCGICGMTVDRESRFPDHRSASLDHVVPLSKGGSHTYENVQCSHYGCNHSKRDKCQGQESLVLN
jgi:hypothetical protein